MNLDKKMGKVDWGMMSHPNMTPIAEIIFLASGKIVWTCMLKCFYDRSFESKTEEKKKNTENPAFQTEFVYVSCI